MGTTILARKAKTALACGVIGVALGLLRTTACGSPLFFLRVLRVLLRGEPFPLSARALSPMEARAASVDGGGRRCCAASEQKDEGSMAANMRVSIQNTSTKAFANAWR